MGEEPHVRERVVQPRPAERAEDGQPRGAPSHRLERRELRVRLVLVDLRADDLDAGVGRRGDVGRLERVQVPHQQRGLQAELPGAEQPAVGRDDRLDAVRPAGPGLVEQGARRHVAVGDEEDVAGGR